MTHYGKLVGGPLDGRVVALDDKAKSWNEMSLNQIAARVDPNVITYTPTGHMVTLDDGREAELAEWRPE